MYFSIVAYNLYLVTGKTTRACVCVDEGRIDIMQEEVLCADRITK